MRTHSIVSLFIFLMTNSAFAQNVFFDCHMGSERLAGQFSILDDNGNTQDITGSIFGKDLEGGYTGEMQKLGSSVSMSLTGTQGQKVVIGLKLDAGALESKGPQDKSAKSQQLTDCQVVGISDEE